MTLLSEPESEAATVDAEVEPESESEHAVPMPESKSTNSIRSAESDSPKSPAAPTHRRVMQVSTDEEGTEWTSDDSVVREWTAVRNPCFVCFNTLLVRLETGD